MSSTMKLFIPYVFTTVGEEKIKYVIEKQECLGTVEKIDIVKRTDDKTGKPFNMAYVHMSEWNHTATAVDAMNTIRKEGKKIVYYTQNKKGPYWSLVEDTYKPKPKATKEVVSPPRLVRNEAVTPPEFIRADSIGECPGAPIKEEQEMYEFVTMPPMNLEERFDSEADVVYETDGLVHENYVTQLEKEIAMLRNLVIQMQMQAFGISCA